MYLTIPPHSWPCVLPVTFFLACHCVASYCSPTFMMTAVIFLLSLLLLLGSISASHKAGHGRSHNIWSQYMGSGLVLAAFFNSFFSLSLCCSSFLAFPWLSKCSFFLVGASGLVLSAGRFSTWYLLLAGLDLVAIPSGQWTSGWLRVFQGISGNATPDMSFPVNCW